MVKKGKCRKLRLKEHVRIHFTSLISLGPNRMRSRFLDVQSTIVPCREIFHFLEELASRAILCSPIYLCPSLFFLSFCLSVSPASIRLSFSETSKGSVNCQNVEQLQTFQAKGLCGSRIVSNVFTRINTVVE